MALLQFFPFLYNPKENAMTRQQQMVVMCSCSSKRTTLFFLKGEKYDLPQIRMQTDRDLKSVFDEFIEKYFCLNGASFKPSFRTLSIQNGNEPGREAIVHLALCPTENQFHPPQTPGHMPVIWVNRGDLQLPENFSEETQRMLSDRNMRGLLFNFKAVPTEEPA